MGLKRGLGLFSTTMYGIGVILGAGIYALISVGAGVAGNMLWAAFLISAFIAVCTALSYAELSSMFPKEAAEYTYSRKAFGREWLSFGVGWVLAIGTIVAASTVALGFGGYLHTLTGIDTIMAALLLVCIMTVMNYWGIEESANFNNLATSLELLGLVLVIFAGFLTPSDVHADLLELPSTGIGGLLAAVSVIFFAYIGFENIANISEEVKDSRKTVPRALVLALGISTVLYMLVAIAAVREVGWQALSESKAPLTLVVSRMLGDYAPILSYIALFATGNTVLMFLIVASRILYGMSSAGSLPGHFSKVGARGTPFMSVAMVGLVAAVVVSLTDIKTVAQLADLAVFIAYLVVNASLLALSGQKAKGAFRGPRLAGFPVLAFLGAISSLIMLAVFPLHLFAFEAIILLFGAILFMARPRKPKSP